MICRAGAVYDRTRFKCLTGEPELRKTCRVILTKALDVETQVIELIPGTIIILSVGETVSLFCSSGCSFACVTFSIALTRIFYKRHVLHVHALQWRKLYFIW